jgi:hypothetical protein
MLAERLQSQVDSNARESSLHRGPLIAGLSRRRSRVRVPSLPYKALQIGIGARGRRDSCLASGAYLRALTCSRSLPNVVLVVTRLPALGKQTVPLAAVACGLGLALLVPVAGLAQVSITASVTPGEVGLTPGGSAEGVLLVSNGGNTPAEVRLLARPADSSVTVEIPERALVGAKSSVPVAFTLTRPAEGSGQDATVVFTVELAPGQDPAQAAVATLKVKAATSLMLVEAKIEANLENINENRPGTAALVITNPRETEVTVTRLAVSAPLAVDVTLTCPDANVGRLATNAGETSRFTKCPVTIAPRSQELLPIELRAEDAVAPGPRSLLARVTATSAGGDSQSVVASTTFTVDVFAESDILKSIGVPIFLLVPGVIIVLIAWFLIRTLPPWRKIAHGVNIGDVVSKATAAAILGLGVSLLVALVYPYLTDWIWPGTERDYTRAYGFRDFYYVVGYSFLIAFLVWAVAALSFWGVRWLVLPWPGDDPKTLLRKIGFRGRLGGSTQHPRVTVDGVGKGLELWSPGDSTLVVPTMAVSPGQGAPNLATDITSHVNSDDAYQLMKAVQHSLDAKTASIAYRADDVPGPTLVKKGANEVKITRARSLGAVVEV